MTPDPTHHILNQKFLSRLMAGLVHNTLAEWWPLPTFVFLNLLFGLGCGILLVRLLGEGKCGGASMVGVVKASCCIGNMGMLPLAMCWAACDENLPRFAEREGGVGFECKESAMAMTAAGLWVAGLAAFTLGDWLVRPREGEGEAGREGGAAGATPMEVAGTGDAVRDGAPGDGDDEVQRGAAPPIQQQHQQQQGPKQPPESSSSSSSCDLGELTKAWGKYVLSNPPLFSSLMALTCAFTPLHKLFLGPGAPLTPLTDALMVMGDALVPIQLIVLGASFEMPEWASDMGKMSGNSRSRHRGGGGKGGDEAGECERGERSLVHEEEDGCSAKQVFLLDSAAVLGVTSVRLIVLPLIGYCLSQAVLNPEADPLIKFVVRVQFTVPTGMTLGTLCLLYDKSAADMARIYTFEYLIAVPLISAWMMVYLM